MEGKYSVCGFFRYLISWQARRKFGYRVHTHVIAVCTRDHVVFNAMMFTLMIRYLSIHAIVVIKNPNKKPIL